MATSTAEFNFTKDHPQRTPEQVFIGNVSPQSFTAMQWETKTSAPAYDSNGSKIPDKIAVLIDLSEIQQHHHGEQLLRQFLPQP